MKVLHYALPLIAVVLMVPAHGQTYQWKDANGRTIISDAPPPGNAHDTRSIGVRRAASSTAAGSTGNASAAPKTLADKELEFKKRQQENKEKAEKQAKEETAKRERQDNCQRARANQAALESDQAVSQYNEKGERMVLEESQRKIELERMRRIVTENCN